jgi:hypothetical protein
MPADGDTAFPLLGHRGSRTRRAVRKAVREVPTAILIIVAIGVCLRVALSIAYQPAAMNFVDTGTYVYMADGHMFNDLVRPAGYSYFLKAVHAVSSEVAVTIAVQHLLGIIAGLLLYGAVRRLGAPVWAACIPAAAVLLNLDQVLFEHTLMAEPLFTVLIALMLYAAVRSLEEPRTLRGPVTTRHVWILVAGLALGGSSWARAVGTPMLAFLAVWLFAAIPGTVSQRLGRAALGAAAGAAVVLSYFALHYESSYSHFGFTRGSGWILYGRVAPFADCTRFDPPAGTSELCEDVPPEQRPGPVAYSNGIGYDSPAILLFGSTPEKAEAANDELAAFARQVILNQPVDYVLTVFNDTTRYLVPGWHSRVELGNYPWHEIRRRDPDAEQTVLQVVNAYYADAEIQTDDHTLIVLTDLQQLLRVHPILMLQAVLLGLLGIAFARGRVRAGIVLFLGTAFLLILVPSATVTWLVRYVIPANGAFLAAGAVGLWVVAMQIIERNRAAPPGSAA